MNDPVLILGHRGFGVRAPCNSKEAFLKAMNSELNGAELDVYIYSILGILHKG